MSTSCGGLSMLLCPELLIGLLNIKIYDRILQLMLTLINVLNSLNSTLYLFPVTDRQNVPRRGLLL
jgi:hypothetical protein